MKTKYYFFFPIIISLILSGCARVVTEERDGPPKFIPNIAKIPNAQPRIEKLSTHGNKPYSISKKQYSVMPSSRGYRAKGYASWYGTKFHGRRTSSGERYDMFGMTGAHRSLPLPTYARVTNVKTGTSIIIKFNDRGPFHHRNLIDLSYTAAAKLGLVQHGSGLVEVVSIDPRDHPEILFKHPAKNDKKNYRAGLSPKKTVRS